MQRLWSKVCLMCLWLIFSPVRAFSLSILMPLARISMLWSKVSMIIGQWTLRSK